MKKLARKPWFIISLITAVAIVWVFAARKNNKTAADFTAVGRGDLWQIVSATGNIKAAQSVDLAFEKSGTVKNVFADVGDKVYAGEILVKLDDSELEAQLAEARANLASADATLNKAQVVLGGYYDDVVDVLNDGYTKANDAVRNQTDVMFTFPETNPQIVFSTVNSQNKINLESQRLLLSNVLNSWLKDLGQLPRGAPSGTLDSALSEAESSLGEVRKFLDLTDKVVVDSVFLSQASASTYKSGINAGRAEINTALANAVSKEQDISQEKAAMASDEASVQSYEANVENYKAQIAKMSLPSPIDGVVTAQNAKVGQIAAANTTVTSVISSSRFDIEAYVPEADIAKIKVGDAATLTLDAYGNGVNFAAKVTKIDPAETVIEGVPTYKVTLQFIKADERIKSGMTANLDIFTASRAHVLVVPQRAVVTKSDAATYVELKISPNGKTEEREIQTGIRGADGNVEVTSGLKEGDEIASFGE